MANEVAVLPQGGKLSKRQKELRSQIRGSDNLISGGGYGKRISIRGGVFRQVVGGEEIAKIEDRTLDMVIIASSEVSRTYYAKKYKEGEDTPPSCWSADGKTPSPQVPESSKQCDTCNDCPQNIKGSGDNDTRACRFSQRLAVMLKGDIKEGGNIYQLNVPSKSLFGSEADDKGGLPLRAYAKVLKTAGSEPVEVSWVVTQARFDPDSTAPKLTFRATSYLEDDEMEAVVWAQNSEDVEEALKMDFPTNAVEASKSDTSDEEDSEEEEAPPVGKKEGKKKKDKKKKGKKNKDKKKKDKAVAEEPPAEDDGDDDPPVVKKKKASTEDDSSAVDSVLDQWDDEEDDED